MPPTISALTRPTSATSSRAVSARARTRAGTTRISNPHEQVVVFCFRFTPFARLHRGQTTTPYICSDEKHERRKACAVVVHRDAQVLNPVIDPTELDPAELRHLPHLPLHHLTERILGPVHVAFRDVPSEIIIAESICDARRDRLAFPPSLLREHAVGDRTHREVPPADGSDSHREDRGD